LHGNILFALAVTAALGMAQTSSPTGAVQGQATDASGGVVAGARVTVRSQDTGGQREAATQADGRFSIGGLAPGTYTVDISAPGFAPVNVKPFLLNAGHVMTLPVALALAAAADRIEVREELEAIDTTASTASVSLGYDRIEEAPARSRNYLNFVLAAPGVAPSAGTSSQRTMTGARSPLGDSGFTFGGIRPRNNAIQIDGLDNRDETTGGSRVAVGLEMVQEFRVAGTAVGAELGGAAGGLLNMITRSGVNLWHGDVTFFAQNEIFNARRTEVAAARPRFRRYQPGVSANGPLRCDKTFISGAIEYEAESAEEWSNVSAAAAAVVPGAYRGLYPTSTRGTDLSLKLNHQATARDTLSARYAFSRGRVRQEVQGPDNFPDRSSQGSSFTQDHSLVGNWMRVISPTLVNDLRVQWAERRQELMPNGRGVLLEIPGVLTMGTHPRLDSTRKERHYQAVEQFNVVAPGGHRLSIGADVHGVTLGADLRNRFAGVFVFPTLADFLARRPDVYVRAFGRSATRMNTVSVGAWIHDRWQIRPSLQLEFGGRVDRQRMPNGVTRSTTNLSPRAGLAWRPSREMPLVVRGGAGLFYDRYPLAFLNEAVQKNGRDAFEVYAVGAAAAGVYTGSVDPASLPRSAYRTSVASFPSAHSRKVTAGVEYGLGKETSFSVETTHIRAFHLPRIRNVTGTLPPAYELEQTGRSSYAGVAFTLNHRPSDELTCLITYNTGRTYDEGSDFDEHPLDPLRIRENDWAVSRQHQRQRLAASAVFELPLPGEWLEDISWAPILAVGSGRPLNALLTADAYRTGAYPISARPTGMARNSFRSPATFSWDLRVMKTWKVLERAILQVGVESFNLTNHPNLERLSGYYATPVGARLATFGQPLESLPGRQLQFLVQFEY